MKVWYPEPLQRLLRPTPPPKLTLQPSHPIAWSNLLIQTSILLLTTALLSPIPWLALATLIIGGLAIILQARSQSQTYSKREAAYQIQLETHLRRLETYATQIVPQPLSQLLSQYTYKYQIQNQPLPTELQPLNQTLQQSKLSFIPQISVEINNRQLPLNWAHINPDTKLHIGILIDTASQNLEHQTAIPLLTQHGWIVIQIPLPNSNLNQTLEQIENAIAKLTDIT